MLRFALDAVSRLDVPDPPADPYAMYFWLNTPFGGLSQFALFGVRGGGSAGDALDIQLNADLILKD